MSHFATIKTKLNNKEALVEGLKQALARKGIFINIEVLDQSRRLVNKYDEDDESFGSIVISHEVLGTPQRPNALVDVGYLWNEDHYELQIDSYDYNINRLGLAFGPLQNFNNAVQLEHDAIVLFKETLVKNYPETEWEYGEKVVAEDGTITMELTKKPQLVEAQLVEAWY